MAVDRGAPGAEAVRRRSDHAGRGTRVRRQRTPARGVREPSTPRSERSTVSTLAAATTPSFVSPAGSRASRPPGGTPLRRRSTGSTPGGSVPCPTIRRRADGGEFAAAVLWAIGQALADPARLQQLRDELGEHERHRADDRGGDRHGEHEHGDDDHPGDDQDHAGGGPPPGRNLAESFWNARPELDRIRQAAHARARSADAVLGAVLARVSMLIPPTMRVDTGVVVPAPLNTYVGLVAQSGGGQDLRRGGGARPASRSSAPTSSSTCRSAPARARSSCSTSGCSRSSPTARRSRSSAARRPAFCSRSTRARRSARWAAGTARC